MMKLLRKVIPAFFLLALAACTSTGNPPAKTPDALAGTRWQLDSIDYMDDTTVKPDDSTKYTLEFDTAGMVGMQADCNRLRGTYTVLAPSGLEFGPLMSTRAACPPDSLYNRVVKDMPFVRSFVIKDGRLHLALMADGGIYNYSPMP
jgi:para-nitrobenzyl esterase